MFSQINLGNGYTFYVCERRLSEGLASLDYHRKRGCSIIALDGDDKKLVMTNQAILMYEIEPESRA